ncbi:glycoside hydrolase family 16 protein [Pontixanthobacter gangjinensis]|uniref:Family 16 glycosylhydrolase n=1 Tax=Pontixanthobacter gangjinensis TaxID=1028742 RepID=A0A6I4SM14_9SPHN|nr:glycoside hydrolase family 16 protein [Pontixanthobacter gangjinensis]MXO56160.1 family 16 glycosylhydrolase [Pontixanthobacter gangjinensis]
MKSRLLSLTLAPAIGALAACSPEEPGPVKIIETVTLNETGTGYAPLSENGWTLAWSDEFSGEAIDGDKWGLDVDCWGGGNQERQCYTDSTENASIVDGKLVITARKQEMTGPALPAHMRAAAEDPDATQTKPFTSARLVTRGKAAWKYGWIEVRAKLPQGQGTWPAIWMLPETNAYGTWARSGEIDIMEAVNLGTECAECPGGKENTILGTLHFGDLWPNNSLNSTEVAQPGSLDDFHTYSLIWSEGKMTWLVDGTIFAVKEAGDWSTAATDEPNAPFDQAFHLILNLAIGGGLPEERGLKGVSEEGFPKEFEIDYVRVWQCDTEVASDGACPTEGG